MAKEQAFEARTRNYIVFIVVIITLCFLVNFPILRWLYGVRTKHCLTPACEKLTRDIRTSMYRRSPPCQDFYKFTCGGWEKSHPGFHDQMEYAYGSVVAEITKNLKKVMVPQANQSAVDKAAAVFQSCVHMINRESSNRDALLRFIGSIGIIWPSGGTLDSLKALDVLVHLSLSVDIHILVTVGLYEAHTGTYSLRISVPQKVVHEYLNDDRMSQERIKEVLTLMFGDSNFDAMLKVITIFEKKISNTLHSVTAVRRFTDTIHILNIGTYTPNQPSSEWISAINKQLSIKKAISKRTRVRVDDIAYLEAISELIVELEDQTLLSWFVGWRVVKELALEASFQEGVALAGTDYVFNEQRCFATVRDSVHFALTTPTILSASEESTRSFIANTAVAVRRSYMDKIRQNHWMDFPTKSRALQKARFMKLLDGYPAFAGSPKQLNNFYSYIPDITGDYMSNILTLRKARMNFLKAYLHTRTSESDLHKWNFPFVSQDSLKFHNDLNQIVVPVAAATEPLYLKHFPTSWRYGGLGTAIAEEMSHAFDVIGKNYDESGSPSDWWSNTTLYNSNQRSHCYLKDFALWWRGGKALTTVDQYRALLASIEAVRHGYHAYILYSAKNRKKLRTIPFLDSEQIFFLGYCYRWCSRHEPRNVMNPHMCNFALAYTKEFTDTFNCQKGDPMYFRRKCD
ncbi:unnamed protein product [Ixodes pacificus]